MMAKRMPATGVNLRYLATDIPRAVTIAKRTKSSDILNLLFAVSAAISSSSYLLEFISKQFGIVFYFSMGEIFDVNCVFF